MGLARTRSLALSLALCNGLLALALALAWADHRRAWMSWRVRSQAAQTLRASTIDKQQRGELD
jgi:uncharacterized membrane protein